MTLDLLAPLGAEALLRKNYIHQLRQTINAYLPAYVFIGEALQNALDAIRDGGAGNHRIAVNMDFDARSVTVQDSGPGFPDRPSLLFLGGGEKAGRGLAGMVGVGLKVVLFSSDRFTLQATNADKSLRVHIIDANQYGEDSPPAIALPDSQELPTDPSPAIATGTGTRVFYRFPELPNDLGVPEQYLRDVKEDCFVGAAPDFQQSLQNAVAKGAFPSRLAALIACHARRYLYLGSTLPRAEFDRLTVEFTVKGSASSLGELAEFADGKSEVTFKVAPRYHTVDDAIAWAPNPKPTVSTHPLGEGGSNLTRTKLGFNRTTYSSPAEFETLLINARGRTSPDLEHFKAKLFPKMRSVTLTIGRIPQFNLFAPGGSRRVISARGVVTQHSIEVSSGQNQQYVRCFDMVVEVDADLNYGKTQLTDMHLVANVRRFVNEAYRLTIQNAARNYVGTQNPEPPTPVPFWSREALGVDDLSILSVPWDENDVIALFFELTGRGEIEGFRWYGLSQRDPYDGRAVIIREGDRSDLLESPAETDLRTVEFKLRGASVARDFDRDEKDIGQVDLVVCYEVGESPIPAYQVVSWEDSTLCRNGEEPYPHVRSVLMDTVSGKEVQLLALKDVLVPDLTEDAPEVPTEATDTDS